MTFGLVHWRNPQQFVFLVGEEDEISAAANTAATYVKEFDKTIHVSYPMGGKRRKLSKPVSSSTSASSDQTIAGSSTTSDSSGSIQTPKKNLTQVLSSWLANTRLATNN